MSQVMGQILTGSEFIANDEADSRPANECVGNCSQSRRKPISMDKGQDRSDGEAAYGKA